jgi:hypothetical protein
MTKLRDYQIELANKGVDILNRKKIVYLNMEVRTGKTLTALEIAKLFSAKNVLFATKKKAIQSILKDYFDFGYNAFFQIVVINNESLHKLNDQFDLVIHDESHRFGNFPKPSTGTRLFKEKYSRLPMIFLSGTMTPESYSQIYHQFWVSKYSPFAETNFYKWANVYVNKKDRYLAHGKITDYSDARIDLIKKVIDPYILTFTQKQAGFTTDVQEEVLTVQMKDSTYNVIELLKRDRVVIGKKGEVLADTAVKLQQKIHQMFSGTIKFEDGSRTVFDYSKAEFIRERFKDTKIGIFYKFKAEWDALKEIFGDNLTNDLQEFNSTGKNIALQIVSGREGISLKEAEYLIYYNIDFSAVSYWQSKDRMTTMERKFNKVFWVFAHGGIEQKIYRSVMNKKNYTLSNFKKDYELSN